MHAAKLNLSRMILILALASAGAISVAADQHDATNAAPRESPSEPNPNVARLSLREAVNLAIENNLGVEVQRHAPLIAEQDVSLAWSAYDPTVSGGASYSNSRAQSSSPFNPTGFDRRITRTGNAGLSGLVPYLGATLSLDYEASRTKANSGIAGFVPQWNSGLSLAASVPLLKGLVWNDPWTQVKVSSVLRDATVEEFRTVLMNTVVSTVSAYWRLVAEEEQLRVAKKSLHTGIALLDQTKTQYEVGVKSKVEVIQAEAGVADRELDVINADARYQNSQDALIDAVFGIRLTPNTVLQVAPTDSPSDFEDIDVDATVATGLALENRPEFSNLELAIERQEMLVRFRKNQRLPQLDLNLAYGTTGLQGKGNPDAFSTSGDPAEDTRGEFGETHTDWFRRRGGRDYSVGGVFSIPLGNYGPRHSVSKARLELRRAKTQLLALHQQIVLQIRRDIRLVDASRKGIDASERQRIAAEEQLRAERIRLEHGESTPFDVLQKESELVEAEVSKIQALQLYRTSVANLDRAQGTILRTHNIVLGSVSALRNGMEEERFGVRDILDPILP